MNLKRLWDTENKKTVWVKDQNGKPHQVWTDGEKLYIYDSGKWNEYTPSEEYNGQEYWPTWTVLDDQEVGYYDTNKPTDLYNRDQGDEASYQFVDYDNTVLKSGTVEEGETPEAPADPTREPSGWNIYTFSGWKPTVWPIYKKTVFKAQYTSTQITLTLANSPLTITVWESQDYEITISPADATVNLSYVFYQGVDGTDFTAEIVESGGVKYLRVTALQECALVRIGVVDLISWASSNTIDLELIAPAVEPSIKFDSWTSDVMTTLEYWEDEEWSNSVAPIWFKISDMETSQLSFSVENCVTWISDTDVTVSYSAAEEWDYNYALTISTAVDLSTLTPNEEDESYFHVVPYYTEDVWATPVALWDVVVCAFVV